MENIQRNIIVTGASRGIGRAMAILMAENGHRVFALTRQPEKISVSEKTWPGGGELIALPFDLLQTATFDKVVKAVERQAGCVDVLINNAGYLVKKQIEALTEEDVDRSFRINAGGVLLFTARLLPLIRKGEIRHIVNIGSMGGVQGTVKFPGLSAYSASKGAVSVLTECMAEEWKEEGIRVNALALGSVQTEMLAEAFPGYRGAITAQEMAAYIMEFALNDWQYYHGKVLPVSVTTP